MGDNLFTPFLEKCHVSCLRIWLGISVVGLADSMMSVEVTMMLCSVYSTVSATHIKHVMILLDNYN